MVIRLLIQQQWQNGWYQIAICRIDDQSPDCNITGGPPILVSLRFNGGCFVGVDRLIIWCRTI
jgi:hypothetical protein